MGFSCSVKGALGSPEMMASWGMVVGSLLIWVLRGGWLFCFLPNVINTGCHWNISFKGIWDLSSLFFFSWAVYYDDAVKTNLE